MDFRNVGTRPDLVPTPSPGEVTETVNLTPLIDVLLVLFIIFILLAGFSRRSLPAHLPPPSPAPGLTQIVLELGDDGRDRLNGQPVPRSQLRDILAAMYRERPFKLLFIRTGSARSYQDFIDAAELARGAGVTMVASVEVRGQRSGPKSLETEGSR